MLGKFLEKGMHIYTVNVKEICSCRKYHIHSCGIDSTGNVLLAGNLRFHIVGLLSHMHSAYTRHISSNIIQQEI